MAGTNPLYMRILMSLLGPSDDELMDAAWQYQAGGGNFSEAGPASSNYAPPQGRTGTGVDARTLTLPILLGAAAGRLGRPTPRPRPRGMR